MSIQYKIIIKQGNLLDEENADFIVNPSNTALVLGSGVSMAFKRHCGHELQIQMTDILNELKNSNYRIKKGDVVPSRSGDSNNFKMDYNPGVHFKDKHPVIDDIVTCLHNIQDIILEYSKLHNKSRISLVIPLMGTGHGGLNKIDVVNQYYKFFSTKQKYSIIDCTTRIYGYSQDDINLLYDCFTDLIVYNEKDDTEL